MELNALSYINGYHSFEQALISEATRQKLIALGIDPSIVTSESQAKTLIEKVEQTRKTERFEEIKTADSKVKVSTSEQDLICRAKNLADKMGIHLTKDLSLDEILTIIAKEIEMVINSDIGEGTKAKYIEYNAELKSIKDGYSVVQSNENAVMNSMNYAAQINKMILGL